MNRLLRLILAVLAGLVIGSIVNMALVMTGPKLIPPPAGADVTTMEGLKATIHLFEPRHFLFPFLAHALGTLVGAAVATVLTPDRSVRAAYAVGVMFMLGGIANCFMLPGPAWFNAVDVILAYLPMAWLGHRLSWRRLG
ncbi:hypothetical protein [Pelomonas sp. SE-A7]|uniref:hypothetical protein n=1 Tax=Pelomonas sp. SE-A7 TaxID=3054953 RepID=UPI00259CF914|nr:hypothetical protein [Pelomonas sp. SE-A7]MDM4766602.1 hypothetical protein [Pelomonas sp. SE-A7]